MFLTMGTWWRFDDIAATASALRRASDGVSMEELENYAARLEAEGAVCALENIPLTPLSSTDVRGKLRRHESVEGLIPPAVAAYIARRGLYTAAEAAPLDRDEQFIEIIRGRLTPARFRHSLAVAEEAERLARKYGADPAKARTAGILHDILKDAGEDAQLQIFQDFAILLDNVERQAPKLWHARAGAVFIEKVLGVEDRDIVTARALPHHRPRPACRCWRRCSSSPISPPPTGITRMWTSCGGWRMKICRRRCGMR